MPESIYTPVGSPVYTTNVVSGNYNGGAISCLGITNGLTLNAVCKTIGDAVCSLTTSVSSLTSSLATLSGTVGDLADDIDTLAGAASNTDYLTTYGGDELSNYSYGGSLSDALYNIDVAIGNIISSAALNGLHDNQTPTNEDLFWYFQPIIRNYISSGFALIDNGDLKPDIDSGIGYFGARRCDANMTSITLDADSDNYIIVDGDEDSVATVTMSSVAIDDPAPSLTGNQQFLMMLRTNGSEIIQQTDLADRKFLVNSMIKDETIYGSAKLYPGSVSSDRLTDTGVDAGDYFIASLSINAQGQITEATELAILAGLADQDILLYDGGAGVFRNVPMANYFGAQADGMVIFSNGTAYTGDVNNLYYDYINYRLGVGVSNPQYTVAAVTDIWTEDYYVADGGSVDSDTVGGTMNIGTANASVITIGRSGATINIIGSTVYEEVTNLQVTDKLITVNKGGGAASAGGAGIEFEENSAITGYIKVAASRSGYDILAPNVASAATILLSSLTAARSFTLPDVAGTFVTTGNLTAIVATGTIASGTWQGTAVAAAYGGTGQSSYTIGDILYASSSSALSKLADVAVGSYLRSGGVGAAPVWSTVTLPNSATTGDLLYASATNVYSNLADIATGNVLLSGGVGVAPSWGKVALASAVSGTLPVANGGTGNTTFTAYAVLCAGTTSTGAFQNVSSVGTSGQVLTSNGAGALPTWQTAATGVTIDSTAITSGSSGRLLFESTTNKVSESADFFVSTSNRRLTIATGVGGRALYVAGSAAIYLYAENTNYGTSPNMQLTTSNKNWLFNANGQSFDDIGYVFQTMKTTGGNAQNINAFNIYYTGLLGTAGITTPTAYLHVSASTTSYASLRIAAGTAPTAPNEGDIWQDGTNIKIYIGGATKTFTIT